MRIVSMMKWRVRRDSHCSSIEHEDIRRSLEVLDSVLAEFDDCLESWDSTAVSQDTKFSESIPALRKKFERCEDKPNGKISNGLSKSHSRLSYPNHSIDSTTSHNSSFIQEQPKVSSPPPIPKRSPTTKLSEKNLNQFSFPSDDTSLDSYDSARSEFTSQGNNGLSEQTATQQQISVLSPKKHGDTERCDNRSKANAAVSADKCSNCGRGLKRKPAAMESTEGKNVPSPFLQRKQMYEAKIAEANASPAINRSYTGSSFRVKKMATEYMDTTSEPSSLPSNLSLENGFNSDVVPASTNGLLSVSSSATSPCALENCTCKDRIQRLSEEFSETRRLLKLKKIKGLDEKPPSFVPELPVLKNGQVVDPCRRLPTGDDAIVPKTLHGDVSEMDETNNTSEDQSFYSADVSNNCVSSIKSEDCSRTDSKPDDSLRLCNRCANCLSAHFSQTIEDFPKLPPTDGLNRPHLGFSYSLEEDLSPGVKEIRQTSTPKSGASPVSLFKTKESNLSTFSQSVSSLGYVSSQSDLELNSISTVPDKVPVSSFKSMTLPNGLDRSPFYSPEDDDHSSSMDKVHSEKGWHDYNDNRLPGMRKSGHMSIEELRSSSAPPPPEGEKPKKKHFRAFSRKSKKDKKNEDNLSMKSDVSLDEGIILRKLSALDGSTTVHDAAAADKMEGGVEKKRRSLWHSIMGKKQT